MRSLSPSFRAMPAFAVLGAGILAASLGSVALAHSDPTEVTPISAPAATSSAVPGASGDGSVSGVPASGEPVSGDGAQAVTPSTKVRDVHPVAIDHISVAADGKTATVYWYGGVDTCYVLASIDVTNGSDGVPVITVSEGTRAELPPDTMCIEIAVLKKTTVTLEQPLFVDGSQQAS